MRARRRHVWALLVALACAALASGAVAPAAAEHEVFYRYVVLGYVKDARGKPVRGRAVEVIRDKTTFSYLGETDARGFYVIVVRLGDESNGETLTLKIGTSRTQIVTKFDPANHTDNRGTRVDVDGTHVVEHAAWFPSSLAQYLGSVRVR